MAKKANKHILVTPGQHKWFRGLRDRLKKKVDHEAFEHLRMTYEKIVVVMMEQADTQRPKGDTDGKDKKRG
jgi:hypothetical protein